MMPTQLLEGSCGLCAVMWEGPGDINGDNCLSVYPQRCQLAAVNGDMGQLCSSVLYCCFRVGRACTGNAGGSLGLTDPSESLQTWQKAATAAGSVGYSAFGLKPSSTWRTQQEQADPVNHQDTISPCGLWRLPVFSQELLGSLGGLLSGRRSC